MSRSQSLLRDPVSPHVTSTRPNFPNEVHVYHPGYTDSNLLLTTFACNDTPCTISPDPLTPPRSVSQSIVHLACAIIANNRFDGFLSKERDSAKAVNTRVKQAQLEPGLYYFHVPNPEEPEGRGHSLAYMYPVCANFQAWEFPTAEFPTIMNGDWIRAIPNSGDRVQRCVMSGTKYGLDEAHIVPQSQYAWYTSNNMQLLPPGSTFARSRPLATMDYEENLLFMRADLHRLWDKLEFVRVNPFASSFIALAMSRSWSISGTTFLYSY